METIPYLKKFSKRSSKNELMRKTLIYKQLMKTVNYSTNTYEFLDISFPNIFMGNKVDFIQAKFGGHSNYQKKFTGNV